MTKLLTSTWMTVLISAVVYLGTTVLCWKTPVRVPTVTESASTTQTHAAVPSWEFINPEADQLMVELKTEKKSMEKKEQDLNDLSVRLDAERAELNLVSQSVQKLQGDFDQNVVRIKDEESANLKKLAKVYSTMSPESAASIFGEMEDVAVVKIMVFMKDGDTAGIFEALAKKGQPEAKRAAALSERIRLAAYRSIPTNK